MSDHVNPFPWRWSKAAGLGRVKNSPYYFKERWPEGDFGDRWRRLKARMRAFPTIRAAAGAGAS